MNRIILISTADPDLINMINVLTIDIIKECFKNIIDILYNSTGIYGT
jgi:hypothetical protein